MMNICQCHANSTNQIRVNSSGAHFGQRFEKHLHFFMSASTVKKCDTAQQTKLSQPNYCSLMQICILRKMTHDKYEQKLIFPD